MLSLGSLVFLNPWLLAGLAALPILWWLLRAVPPSPRRQTFAGVRLLLGLEDEERQTHKTPWWLLLLRCLAVAAVLIGLSEPVTNLTKRIGGGTGRVLVLMDQGWASAPEWGDRVATVRAILEEAADQGREVVLWPASEPKAPPTMSARAALAVLGSLEPRPWNPDHGSISKALAADGRGITETIWLHDGLGRDDTGALLETLRGFGPIRLIGPVAAAKALTPPRLESGVLKADVLAAGEAAGQKVIAFARSETGGERRIAVATAKAGDDKGRATATFDLPPVLQGTVTRIVLEDRPSAGGAAFADGAIRRVSARMVAGHEGAAVTTLVSATHYIKKAIVPWADLTRSTLLDAVAANPAVIILADRGDMTEEERAKLTEWIGKGGLLIRFAGPRLAASIGARGFGAVDAADPLLPVRLRRGGRVLGGALAWSAPRKLGPFGPKSPFRGLKSSKEVQVRTQVLAEPSPDLAGKVWAALDDGTPLVTAKRIEGGTVVLFHVSSDAEWSSLPLSGLFVEMLGRLMTLAPGRAAGMPDKEAIAGTLWRPETVMGADGTPVPVSTAREAVPGERIHAGKVGPGLDPGVYARTGRREAGEAESIVLNLTTKETKLVPFPVAPAGATSETLGGTAPRRYGAWLLALAAILAVLDILGTLFVSGRLGSRTRAAPLLILAAMMLPFAPGPADAQDDVTRKELAATAETTLGYVVTGNSRIDRTSARGLVGLGNALARRTAIEPGPPVGVDAEKDVLSYYPVLYMPLTAETLPSARALERLAVYLQTGGMLIIDTQNGPSGFGGASATQMRAIARALNLPPLAPVNADHVLTRTFYLLNNFPGRWRGGRVWSEAAPPRPAGVPKNADIPKFDRVDDNVSPVLVGSADWAAAWAVDETGRPLFPIGRAGDRQREMAIRFGVNAVMYALTGNYKSDQVHAPAVLKRLGQ